MAEKRLIGCRNGLNDPFRNLVGLQLTDGTSLFTLSSFNEREEVDTISDFTDDIEFSIPYTLENFNLSVTENRSLLGRLYAIELNFDKTNPLNYAYFFSFKNAVNSAISEIKTKWPGSLYSPKTGTKDNIVNIVYDAVSDETMLEIPIVCIVNDFNINLDPTNDLAPTFNIKNILKRYYDYVLLVDGVEYVLIDFIGTNFGNIKITVKGNPFVGLSSTSTTVHIKPSAKIFTKFYNSLKPLGKHMLNRCVTPIYSFEFSYVVNEERGNVLKTIRFSFPTKDGYNLALSGVKFEKFEENLLKFAEYIDYFDANVMNNYLVSDNIFEYDNTEFSKIDIYLNVCSCTFDVLKFEMDGISHVRNVTYDKKNNIPDGVIKIAADSLGWNTFSTINDKNILEVFSENNRVAYPGFNKEYSVYEIDIEFWRRLVINTPWIFKAKGTRKVMDFFFEFIGAPPKLITLDEHVYVCDYALDTNLIKEKGINPTYITSDGYPRVYNNANHYFQMKGGWDANGEDLHIDSGYDNGQAYYDVYRDLGFNFDKVKDNKKSWVGVDDPTEREYGLEKRETKYRVNNERLLLNSKEVDLYIDAAAAIEEDIKSICEKCCCEDGARYYIECLIPYEDLCPSLSGCVQYVCQTYGQEVEFEMAHKCSEVKFGGGATNDENETKIIYLLSDKFVNSISKGELKYIEWYVESLNDDGTSQFFTGEANQDIFFSVNNDIALNVIFSAIITYQGNTYNYNNEFIIDKKPDFCENYCELLPQLDLYLSVVGDNALIGDGKLLNNFRNNNDLTEISAFTITYEENDYTIVGFGTTTVPLGQSNLLEYNYVVDLSGHTLCFTGNTDLGVEYDECYSAKIEFNIDDCFLFTEDPLFKVCVDVSSTDEIVGDIILSDEYTSNGDISFLYDGSGNLTGATICLDIDFDISLTYSGEVGDDYIIICVSGNQECHTTSYNFSEIIDGVSANNIWFTYKVEGDNWYFIADKNKLGDFTDITYTIDTPSCGITTYRERVTIDALGNVTPVGFSIDGSMTCLGQPLTITRRVNLDKCGELIITKAITYDIHACNGVYISAFRPSTTSSALEFVSGEICTGQTDVNLYYGDLSDGGVTTLNPTADDNVYVVNGDLSTPAATPLFVVFPEDCSDTVIPELELKCRNLNCKTVEDNSYCEYRQIKPTDEPIEITLDCVDKTYNKCLDFVELRNNGGCNDICQELSNFGVELNFFADSDELLGFSFEIDEISGTTEFEYNVKYGLNTFTNVFVGELPKEDNLFEVTADLTINNIRYFLFASYFISDSDKIGNIVTFNYGCQSFVDDCIELENCFTVVTSAETIDSFNIKCTNQINFDLINIIDNTIYDTYSAATAQTLTYENECIIHEICNDSGFETQCFCQSNLDIEINLKDYIYGLLPNFSGYSNSGSYTLEFNICNKLEGDRFIIEYGDYRQEISGDTFEFLHIMDASDDDMINYSAITLCVCNETCHTAVTYTLPLNVGDGEFLGNPDLINSYDYWIEDSYSLSPTGLTNLYDIVPSVFDFNQPKSWLVRTLDGSGNVTIRATNKELTDAFGIKIENKITIIGGGYVEEFNFSNDVSVTLPCDLFISTIGINTNRYCVTVEYETTVKLYGGTTSITYTSSNEMCWLNDEVGTYFECNYFKRSYTLYDDVVHTRVLGEISESFPTYDLADDWGCQNCGQMYKVYPSSTNTHFNVIANSYSKWTKEELNVPDFMDEVWVNYTHSKDVRKFPLAYAQLGAGYYSYLDKLNNCGVNVKDLNYLDLFNYIELIEVYWFSLIEQLIPSSTIWNGKKLISNVSTNQCLDEPISLTENFSTYSLSEWDSINCLLLEGQIGSLSADTGNGVWGGVSGSPVHVIVCTDVPNYLDISFVSDVNFMDAEYMDENYHDKTYLVYTYNI